MVTQRKETRQVRRQQVKKQNKIERAQHNLEKEVYRNVSRLFREVFSEEKIEELAKKTKLQQRKRELTPIVIVSILTMGCLNDNSNPKALEKMCLLLREWFNIYIKPQSLSAKINSQNTVKFIKAVMSEVMKHEVNKVLNKLLKKSKIQGFTRILLQDSTVISLPDTLKRIFKGCGGSASEAAIKCDFIIDQRNNLVLRVKCVSGRVPDASLSSDIINYIEEDDLVIRDLGYFNFSQLLKIKQNKAYFISRLVNSAQVYLSRDDENPVSLIKHLTELGIDEKKPIDIALYIGVKDRILVRLIAVKVPLEVIEARRQQYKKKRGRSQEPSEALAEWNGYTFMVTNVPQDKLSLRMILKMYKIRWQIELFFKNMKSKVCIDKLTGKNKYRIQCIVYTKLMITWVITIIHAYAQTKVMEDKKISISKLTDWLMEEDRLKKGFVHGRIKDLLDELERDLDLLCKQKRKYKRDAWLDEIESYQEEHITAKAA